MTIIQFCSFVNSLSNTSDWSTSLKQKVSSLETLSSISELSNKVSKPLVIKSVVSELRKNPGVCFLYDWMWWKSKGSLGKYGLR